MLPARGGLLAAMRCKESLGLVSKSLALSGASEEAAAGLWAWKHWEKAHQRMEIQLGRTTEEPVA